MALPESGPLALTDIQTEFGGSNPIGMNEYYAGGGLVPPGTSGTYGAVPSSGALSVQNFYGTSAVIPAYIEEVFSTYLYTGNGSTQTITNGIDLAGEGGLVWIKRRSSAGSHSLWDTARGVSKALLSNESGAEQTVTSTQGLTAFNNNGFSVGTNAWSENTSGVNIASWTFRKQPKFFDIVTYTGTGSVQNIAHNLGSVPGCILIKCIDNGFSWFVYHRGLGATKRLLLNNTSAAATESDVWNDTEPTATNFTLGSRLQTNGSGYTYVAYLFAHNAGGFGLSGEDNVISCGSFTGTGAQQHIELGWEPQFFLMKQTNAEADWFLLDNMRGMKNGESASPTLSPNTSGAELSGGQIVSPTATGVDPYRGAGQEYIYIAIRRGPMKVPESGTSVFAPYVRSTPPASYPSFISGFPVDLGIRTYQPGGSSYYPMWSDRLRGPKYLISSTNSAEGSFGVETFDFMNGWGSVSASNEVSWMFRRAPGFFDVVCYTGSFSNRQQSHNLGVVPEMMIVKARTGPSAQFWNVYHAALGASAYLSLDLTDAVASSTWPFNGTTPTSSLFYVGIPGGGNYAGTNASGYTYVAYLFATCIGVSKVGSYTGTGATQVINCGFTGGARFVLIKATSTTGNWYVWDSARGIVAGNDPYLTLNTTAAEVTSTDWVDTAASGFELSNAGGNLANSNGVSYIFLAIA